LNPLEFADKHFGKEATQAKIQDWIAQNPSILAFWLANLECQARWAKAREDNKQTLPEDWTFEELHTWIKHQPVFHAAPTPRRWAKNASIENLEKAALALEKASDAQEIQGLLSIFTARPFPRHLKLLFELAQNPVLDIVQWALPVLYQISHPDIRNFVFKYQQVRPDHPKFALGILTKNYQAGDHLFIENAISTEIPDKYDFEDLVGDVLRIFTKNLTPDAQKSLELVYCKSNCLHCRQRCVKLLEQIGILSNAILKECVFDASLELRAWAKATLEAWYNSCSGVLKIKTITSRVLEK
jgi:hypothetical protein